MHDSGKREQFTTGAVRDTAQDKPRPDLISPFALERLGEWLRIGAQKYRERNWEQGIPLGRTVASLYRHLLKYQQGAADEDHLAAIMCNAMFLIHTEEMIRRGVLPAKLDDLPRYTPPAPALAEAATEAEDIWADGDVISQKRYRDKWAVSE